MPKKSLQISTLETDALRVSGPDAFGFLQGMLTADVRRGMRAQNSFSPYGGGTFLLDQKAKIVAPGKYWVFRDREIFLSLPKGSAAVVALELEKFHVADDLEISLPEKTPWQSQVIVRFESASEAFPIVEVPGPGDGANDRVYALHAFSAGYALPLPEWGAGVFQLWINDLKAFKDEFETRPFAKSDFEALRFERGIPQWSVDFDRDSFVLEYPHATEISFFKGCYKGQEVVARGTYRGSMPKGFARFNAKPDVLLSPGFVYNTEDPIKPVGKITSAHQNRGLGLIRLSALQTGKLFQGEDSTKRTEIANCDVLIQGRE